MKIHRPLWALLVWGVCAASACSSADPEPGAGAGGAGASGTAGAGATGGAGRGSGSGGSAGGEPVGGFSVTIEAARTTLCPGECVELSASARDGRPPYAYSWSPELGAGEGPHEVCPGEDTTYTVTARDVALEDDEFGMRSQEASASIALRVAEPCEPSDGGMDGGEPEGTEALCSLRVPYTGMSWISSVVGWEGSTNIEADADGDLIIAGTFSGTIDFGGEPLTSVGMHDAFIVKLDSECKHVWSKSFGAPGTQLGFGAVGVGPDGDPAVGGVIAGSADLGLGAIASGFNHSALVAKLDGESGAAIWNQVYPGLIYPTEVWDVGVDGDNAIVFSGHATSDTSFGGPVLGGRDGNFAYIAKLTSSGTHVFSYGIEQTDLWSSIAVHPAGTIALSGWATGGTAFSIGGGIVDAVGDGWQRFALVLDPMGGFEWATMIGEDQLDTVGWWGGMVAIDGDRNVIVEHTPYEVDDAGRFVNTPLRFSKLDASGMVLWSKELGDRTRSEFYMQGGLRTDSAGNILHADEVDAPGAPAIDAGPSDVDVRVRKLTPGGDVIWWHRFGGLDTFDWAWGLSVDRDDAVWFAHIEDRDTASNEGALVVTKLAP